MKIDDTNVVVRSHNSQKVKHKGTKRQTVNNKTLHIQLKIEQHDALVNKLMAFATS
jgi:hypothetical protein